MFKIEEPGSRNQTRSGGPRQEGLLPALLCPIVQLMEKSKVGKFFGNGYVQGILLIVAALLIGSIYTSLTGKVDIAKGFVAVLSFILFSPIPSWYVITGLVVLFGVVRTLRLYQKPSYARNYTKDEIHGGTYRWVWEGHGMGGRWYPLDFELICPDCECKLSGQGSQSLPDPGPGRWCPDCRRGFDNIKPLTPSELASIVIGRARTRYM